MQTNIMMRRPIGVELALAAAVIGLVTCCASTARANDFSQGTNPVWCNLPEQMANQRCTRAGVTASDIIRENDLRLLQRCRSHDDWHSDMERTRQCAQFWTAPAVPRNRLDDLENRVRDLEDRLDKLSDE